MFTYKIKYDAKTLDDWPPLPAGHVSRGLIAYLMENGLCLENYIGNEKPDFALTYEDATANRHTLAEFIVPSLETLDHVKAIGLFLVEARGLREVDNVTLTFPITAHAPMTMNFRETCDGPEWYPN